MNFKKEMIKVSKKHDILIIFPLSAPMNEGGTFCRTGPDRTGWDRIPDFEVPDQVECGRAGMNC